MILKLIKNLPLITTLTVKPHLWSIEEYVLPTKVSLFLYLKNKEASLGQTSRTQICHSYAGNKNYPMARHYLDSHYSNPSTLQGFGTDHIPISIQIGDRQIKLRHSKIIQCFMCFVWLPDEGLIPKCGKALSEKSTCTCHDNKAISTMVMRGPWIFSQFLSMSLWSKEHHF